MCCAGTLTSGVSVVDYLCIGSQYTNKPSYGLYPERMLAGGSGDWNTPVSIGGFGGYITFQLDEPVANDPNNPYGVDFIIYGSSNGGQGSSEPGNVLVSEDGVNWYALAGSDYFDDNTEWGLYADLFRGADNKIYWEDRWKYGNNASREHPPTNENYPLASFDPAQPITVTGALLKSSAADDYGTSAAAYPDWGYVDAQRNREGIPHRRRQPGSGFDLSWAVDADGTRWSFNSVNYMKVMTASHIDGGAIGEKSTEVNPSLRLPRRILRSVKQRRRQRLP